MKRRVVGALTLCCLILAAACQADPSETKRPPTWEERVEGIRWVAYSSPSANPGKGVDASTQAIRDDLTVLRRAGFTGLVTYGSTGNVGLYLPQLAESAGFRGLILGVWDPTSEEEIARAVAASNRSIVLGYVVGNEGLTKRYTMEQLGAAMARIRTATAKKVTTTEEIDDYADPALLGTGDWVFPNTHPYFHNQLAPDLAMEWTRAAYDDVVRRAKRFVMLKEVGLPTEGVAGQPSLEDSQRAYYEALARTDVRFVYFEAFDQPWKLGQPVESHWGLFRADRSPKAFAASLIDAAPTVAPSDKSKLHVYRDVDTADNHYTPSGFMGDIGDVSIDDAFGAKPHSGFTSIRIAYAAKGRGPHSCEYDPPCKWAGVFWQDPPNNWGTNRAWAGAGLDLSRYHWLRFWARADAPGRVEFKVGGINQTFGDSLRYSRTLLADLELEWREYSIDLTDADLSRIIGGFAWVTNLDTNPSGLVFYVDDVRFEA